MAERRMFAKTIIDSDAFLDMPLSTQALYFHLSMRADDDGFINNPKKIQRMVGCSDDDMKILIMKNFIITFDSGVIVIKHWRIHNYLRADRYKATVYLDEKEQLQIEQNGSYTLNYGIPVGIPSGIPMVDAGKDSIDKNSIDKNSIDKDSIDKDSIVEVRPNKRFRKPTVEEVKEYCKERNNKVDAERFIDHYDSVGWRVGNSPMKDWKATVRTWEKREYDRPKKAMGGNARYQMHDTKSMNFDALITNLDEVEL